MNDSVAGVSSPRIVGETEVMVRLRGEIAHVAASDAKILITGESGTGKELVAREIHARSSRADRPLIVVNCAGLSEALMESELFGHARGSFTGAYRDRPGKLEYADEGTVFLDEIGDMTPRMQALLLRFLETGEVHKVGDDDSGRRVRVRTIAATNHSLTDLILEGRFRQDLFYRLNVVHLEVPPLRDRRRDIPLLVEYFLNRAVRPGRRHPAITSNALAELLAHRWPGNVRELENAVDRMLIHARGETLDVDDIPAHIRAGRSAGPLPFGERRRTIVDDLYARMIDDRQSFWTTVYPLYMRREITREQLRTLVARALREAGGNYRVVTHLFRIQPQQYKKFLNFLRKQECQLPFREYR